ncbi:hypothetical protein [Burkholderia stagnalis]|uniref:hypothetical protein n=1 Tax=Burkholderia stagnalis TaxID=1503054 RepID=UPI000F80008B|nr:hypothetical protein [Burkholderia stagnalis]
MKWWRVAILTIGALALCYVGAGAPPVELLFKPSVLPDGLALKSGTWHYRNHEDHAGPAAEFLASRFYTLLIAALCGTCGVAVIRAEVSWKRLAFFIAVAIALQLVFYYAQMRAFYQPW